MQNSATKNDNTIWVLLQTAASVMHDNKLGLSRLRIINSFETTLIFCSYENLSIQDSRLGEELMLDQAGSFYTHLIHPNSK
jgi:hypothetical protein